MTSNHRTAFFVALAVALLAGGAMLYLLGSRDPQVLALMRAGWLPALLAGVATLAFGAVGHSGARALRERRATTHGVTLLGIAISGLVIVSWLALAALACNAGLCEASALPR